MKDSIRSKKAVVNNIDIVNSTAPSAHKDNQIFILSKDASTSNEYTIHLYNPEISFETKNINGVNYPQEPTIASQIIFSKTLCRG